MVSVNAAEQPIKSQSWNVSITANNGYMDETPAKTMTAQIFFSSFKI